MNREQDYADMLEADLLLDEYEKAMRNSTREDTNKHSAMAAYYWNCANDIRLKREAIIQQVQLQEK